ncbi:CBS domain-containing protein [Vulcanisaeta thermophila]|uniref:CBS domain-containing protein n=1 Tax=Vulcanisaeta thermophila TaxID=867917 RepID=UPI000853629F|nr:CBS domain-containing protein [Vulcanisaeta thermophila]
MPSVSELMESAVVVVKPKDLVSRVISEMRERRIWLAPVVNDNGKLVGVVSYRDLLERRVGLKSKVSSIMSPPYSINEGADYIKGIEKILSLRVRALPVVDNSMGLRGLLTRESLLRYLRESNRLPRASVGAVMSKPAITINADEAVARAKWLMIRHGITRLPVLDGGKLYGIITMRDIIERLYYASMPRRSKRGDVVGTEDDILAAPVRALATTPVVTVKEGDDLNYVVDLMLSKGISGMPVLSGDSVVGVVSGYDILRAVIKPFEEVPIEARLVDVDEDSKALIEKVVSNYVAKLNRMTNIIDLKVNIKRYEGGGGEKRSKYSVHLMLKDDNSTYTVNEVDWDPINAVRYAFETLMKRVERNISRMRDIRRGGRLRGGPPTE